MDIDIDDFETRYELITELLKHLQKREVSKEDKRILYDMIINKGYGTDKEREHFINRFNLTGEGEEYKSYASYARSTKISSARIIQISNRMVAKIGRKKNIEDLTKLQEINIRSRKNSKTKPQKKRGEVDA